MNTPQQWIDLTGKVAHVTGAAKGIGAGIATALSMAGAKVMLSDINVEGASSLADELRANADTAAMSLDVTSADAVNLAMQRTVNELGGLDILLNNAGVYQEFGGPVRDITDDMWRTLWSVNVDGVFYCCRAAADIMIQQGQGGRIINISSTQAVTPGVGVTYDGSKAAVAQITKALALAPHKINVNALAPGPTWVQDGPPSPMDGTRPPPTGHPLADTVQDRIARLPAGHWGDPLEQGKAALFLASPMSDFVTGVYLPCDGGWLTL